MSRKIRPQINQKSRISTKKDAENNNFRIFVKYLTVIKHARIYIQSSVNLRRGDFSHVADDGIETDNNERIKELEISYFNLKANSEVKSKTLES